MAPSLRDKGAQGSDLSLRQAVSQEPGVLGLHVPAIVSAGAW